MTASHSISMDRAKAFAHMYARWGWQIFPCHAITAANNCTCKKTDCEKQGKHPAVKWASSKSNDHGQIDAWWHYSKEFVANIGIATGQCSGITVIDIDPRHGGDETWAAICSEIDIPDTYTVETGGGGYHLYFKYNPKLKTSTNAFGQGVDIRNDGGYVLAPPSNHISGKEYALFRNEFDPNTLAMPELAILPDKLLNKIKAPVRDLTPTKITLAQATKLLDYVSSEGYDQWLKVGIILGRAFNRSEDAWALYCNWSDKGWDKRNPKQRNATMKDAFYHLSTKDNENGENLSVKTLIRWAELGGYTEIANSFDMRFFCYLASENVFISLLTGEKWLASGVNNTIKPVIEDGISGKPSQWLANNKAVISMISDGSLPYGIIDGHFSYEGIVRKKEGTRLLNFFKFNTFAPLQALTPDTLNRMQMQQTAEQAQARQQQPAQAYQGEQQWHNQPAPQPSKTMAQQSTAFAANNKANIWTRL